MKYICLIIMMLTSFVLTGADQFGRVTSSEALILNGKPVPATAVSSLPVVAGDEIVTSASPATIFLMDKSRATVAPNSKVKLEVRDSAAVLRVLSGKVEFRPAKGSRASLIDSAGRLLPIDPASRAFAQANPFDNKPCSKSKSGQGNQNCQGQQ